MTQAHTAEIVVAHALPYRQSAAPDTESLTEIVERVRQRFEEVERELAAMDAPRVKVGWFDEVRYAYLGNKDSSVSQLAIGWSHWGKHEPVALCRAVRLLPRLLRKARRAVARRNKAIRQAQMQLEIEAQRASKALR